MLKADLQEILKSILADLGISDIEPQIERPADMSHGDYSTNIALVAFKKYQVSSIKNQEYKTPLELAEEIVRRFMKQDSRFKKVEVAAPGFINFWISKEELFKNLQSYSSNEVRSSHDARTVSRLQDKKIMIEYGDANTHKLPHIGHLFSYIYGESIVRLLAEAGANVRRVSYQGDVGLHVAKCLWAFQKEQPEEPESVDEKVLLLQKMYQIGSAAASDSKEINEEIKQLNKKIYEKDSEVYSLYLKTRQWSIEYYQKFEKRLDIAYERHYFESEVYESGKQIVESNIDKLFTRSEGAIVFKGSDHGLHDRVFVTQYGTPTYEAKDMYLQQLKMNEWPMDLLIITTASEQNGYFDVVFKALEELDEKYKGKLLHLGFGMVNLKSGKMSSRTGEIIGAEDLIEMTVKRVREVIADREDLSEEGMDRISEMVGLGAIKYSFLKSNYAQNIQFDLEESISLDGNSGPYLQYTYARTQSVLRKAQESSSKYKVLSIKYEPEEEILLRMLYFFGETVIEAAEKYSPNIVANYLYNLASAFNLFYQKHQILTPVIPTSSLVIASKAKQSHDRLNQRSLTNASVDDVRNFRLALTKTVSDTIKKGLNLLGIEAPERM